MRATKLSGKLTILSAALLVTSVLFLPSASLVGKGEEGEGEQEKLEIAVSLPDIVPIVRSIGGNRTSEFNILPEGGDPHSFTPTASGLNRIKESDIVVFAISEHLDFEKDIRNSLEDDGYDGIILDFDTDYKQNGAVLEDFPGFENCIHGYWLKPENGIAMASSVARALIQSGMDSQLVNSSLFSFEREVELMKENGRKLVEEAGLAGSPMAAAVPAVNYILSSFGMEVGVILSKEEAGFISGEELSEVGKKLEEGKYKGIACPEVFSLGKAGEFSQQLANDHDSVVVYLQLFRDKGSYTGMGYMNSAALSNSRNSEEPEENGVGAPYIAAFAFLIIAAVEAVVILNHRKKQVENTDSGGIFAVEKSTKSGKYAKKSPELKND